MIYHLGQGQLKALRILRDKPNMEASEVADAAGCSWEGLLCLDMMGLITIGAKRVQVNACHPVVTEAGLDALNKVEGCKPDD